ncbi:MAG: hypothetical protein ACOX20_09390 [Limnochordia bacterium]
MNNLEKMALLIQKNPSITGKELARQLGYAQEKSIYYWLNKWGYKGLREFKDEVLSWERRPYSQVGESGMRYMVQELPLQGIDRESVIPLVVSEGELSAASFALAVSTDDYYPLVGINDLIIVDPRADFVSGDLFLLSGENDQLQLRRLYDIGDEYLIIHPLRGSKYGRLSKTSRALVGKVVRMVRHL